VYLQVGGLARRLTRASCRSHIRDVDPEFERRRYPRKPTQIEAEVLSKGSVLRAVVTNVSERGLQVEVPEPIESRVTVRLPRIGGDRLRPIAASVVYCRKRSADWLCGLAATSSSWRTLRGLVG
jgi:hypothetical protein